MLSELNRDNAMKNFLTKYFNKATASNAAWTIGAGVVAAFNFSSGGTLGLLCGAVMTGVALQSANRWQQQATGRSFW